MQIIQGIRDKGAAIVIVVISLSLIGFILMDANQGGGKMFGSSSGSLGKINGTEVEQNEFTKKVKILEAQQQQQSGNNISAAQSAQIREQVWNQIVAERVFYAEAAKLGIDFTSKELENILKSNDPSNPLLQDNQMKDPATGMLDMSKVSQAIANIKKMKGDQRDMIDAQVIDPQKITSVSTKYFALLNASAYYPAWMEESDLKETKNFANISYVAIPYNVIEDSTIKVTDSEIEKYIQSHKGLFKQEAGRMISYVSFSQLPSSKDSAKTKAIVENLKADFANETNEKTFLARNASVIDFDTAFVPKAKIKSRVTDSIINMQTGSVYGPYVENNDYVIAKLLGSKTLPDSVNARHILIATVNAQTGEPIMEDSTAKRQADSIFTALKGGANFALLALEYSSDGSKDKGGDLGTFEYGAMVPEFNSFCFNKPVGSMDVVRTQFGYHIVEVMKQKGQSPAYKIAFMAKEIFASEETISKASNDAIKLSGEKDASAVDLYLKKNGIQKITPGIEIKENDAQVGQLQDARQLVRWVFKAKKGEVSDPFSIGDQFVVAIVDKINKKGTQDIETARPMAQGAIKEQKKAEVIGKKLAGKTTLEDIAAVYQKEVLSAGQDSSLTFKSQIINGIGDEPKLIGAVFNKDNLNKPSTAIAGKTGVYFIKVNGIASKAPDTALETEQLRVQQTTALRNAAASNWFEGLRNKATVKDNRSEFY